MAVQKLRHQDRGSISLAPRQHLWCGKVYGYLPNNPKPAANCQLDPDRPPARV